MCIGESRQLPARTKKHRWFLPVTRVDERAAKSRRTVLCVQGRGGSRIGLGFHQWTRSMFIEHIERGSALWGCKIDVNWSGSSAHGKSLMTHFFPHRECRAKPVYARLLTCAFLKLLICFHYFPLSLHLNHWHLRLCFSSPCRRWRPEGRALTPSRVAWWTAAPRRSLWRSSK